jgi:hypothetical protein
MTRLIITPHPVPCPVLGAVLGAGSSVEDAVDQGVGHDLAAAAWVAGGGRGVGGLSQRGEDGDPVGDREQRRELTHDVGGGAEGDVAVGLGAGAAFDHGCRVEAVGDLLGCGVELPDPHLLEAVGVAGELGVDGQSVFEGEAGGFAVDHGRGPFGDPAGPERGPGVGELGAQDLREAEVALPSVG